MLRATEKQELGQKIYQALDQFTGGIEDFIQRGADETYKCPPYMDFGINVLMGRRVLFGFWKESDSGDMIPDPAISVTLSQGTADLDGLVFDNFMGYTKGIENGQADYTLEFLREMINRKEHFEMERVINAEYPEEGETQ
jgi:hypothetical protein